MTLKSGLHPLALFFFIIFYLCSTSTMAAPSMAMGYTPKYKPGFSYFDYVDPNAKKGGRLVLSGFGTFDSLNPYILKGVSAEGLGLVFETLMQSSKDEPFSMYGLIASDIDFAKDKMSVTFTLNPEARFSNGDPITAKDVKYSFDTLMSDKAHPQYRFLYADVKQAEVLSKKKIRFDFKKQNPELHLILGNLPVFSPKWAGDTPFDRVSETIPVGSGPYRVKSFSIGKEIVYERNKNYWGKDLPVRKGTYNFDEVVYKYYKDQTIALEAFKAGEFDFFVEYHSKRWARDHVGPRYDSGEIIKKELKHKNNAGMQGFVFNTRRELFKGPKVREALILAFDFEWSNSHLFYNQYVRNESYFSNSELASSGLPKGEELDLLKPYRKQLPDSVFTQVWQAPSTKTPASLRKNLRKAQKLLRQAGWQVKDGKLVNQKGEPFEFEFMLIRKGFERIMAPYARNLARLGITMNYRTVDASLYERRIREFDFDMVVSSFPESQSPGNELKTMFHSSSAELQGSRNLAGIANPVVDAMVNNVIEANNRHQLITACHALDRVLLHGNYLVPNWYINVHRIAYWDKFKMPRTLPLYYEPMSWMLETWSMKEN